MSLCSGSGAVVHARGSRIKAIDSNGRQELIDDHAMCGIVGCWHSNEPSSMERLAEILGGMAATLVHRGPDADGMWVDVTVGVALGHRRLSVIDPTEAGGQPMVSRSQRYIISYNGEIYNFRELRRELEARRCSFRGASDTEVLLESFDTWGVDTTLQKVNGMFALALWDRQRRRLHLARDRMGIKPLYWGRLGDILVFGSELKALTAHPHWEGSIDESAVVDVLRFLYVPSPRSIYKNVYKVEPGTVVSFDAELRDEKTSYWSMADAVSGGAVARQRASGSEVVDELDNLLGEIVGGQMIADVPLGAFLSGGIDSSIVVAQMQKRASGRVKTFSIGYRENDYDEAPYARCVAAHLGTEHTELYVRSEDAIDLIPHLPSTYDEPFADASQIPTFLVSELARRDVTVSLSGDGGDELFGGYDRYFNTLREWNRQSWVPRAVARNLARSIELLSVDTWERLLAPLPSRLKPLRDPRKSIPYLLELLRSPHIDPLHQRMVQHCEEVPVVCGAPVSDSAPWIHREDPATSDSVERMTYFDAVSLLADGLLTKVDRASMANSLEVRVPLLDHRLVEFVWRLPGTLKFRRNETKWLLRQALYRHVPRSLVDRPKVGFHLPLREWLGGPLREWAESLLSPSALKSDGLLDAERIRSLWGEVLTGRPRSHTLIWAVLMYRAWRERWLSGEAVNIHRQEMAKRVH